MAVITREKLHAGKEVMAKPTSEVFMAFLRPCTGRNAKQVNITDRRQLYTVS